MKMLSKIMPRLQIFVEGLHLYKLKILEFLTLQYFLTATLEVRSN